MRCRDYDAVRHALSFWRCRADTGASVQKSPNSRPITLITKQRVLCRKDLSLLQLPNGNAKDFVTQANSTIHFRIGDKQRLAPERP